MPRLNLGAALVLSLALTAAIPAVPAIASPHPSIRGGPVRSGEPAALRVGIGAATLQVPAGIGANLLLSPNDRGIYSETIVTQDPSNHSRLLAGSKGIQ